jgi:hypothetical protein
MVWVLELSFDGLLRNWLLGMRATSNPKHQTLKLFFCKKIQRIGAL